MPEVQTVQEKPIRGTLTNCTHWVDINRIEGTLSSPDACEGELGRNQLTQGQPITTSCIVGFSHGPNKELIAETLYSRYIIDGGLQVTSPTMMLSKSGTG